MGLLEILEICVCVCVCVCFQVGVDAHFGCHVGFRGLVRLAAEKSLRQSPEPQITTVRSGLKENAHTLQQTLKPLRPKAQSPKTLNPQHYTQIPKLHPISPKTNLTEPNKAYRI